MRKGSETRDLDVLHFLFSRQYLVPAGAKHAVSVPHHPWRAPSPTLSPTDPVPRAPTERMCVCIWCLCVCVCVRAQIS